MGLAERLGRGPVTLDTAVFIYYMEEHPDYLPLLQPVFEAIDGGRLAAYTSGVTLLETLVAPYREGDMALAGRYETLLTTSRGLRMVHLDLPLLRAAAQLRAVVSVKTPDAIQLAAALRTSSRFFLTNDRDLPQLAQLRILLLSDMV